MSDDDSNTSRPPDTLDAEDDLDLDEEALEYFRNMPLRDIPVFLETIEEETGGQFIFVVSSKHREGTMTLVEVDEEELTDDGRMPVPISYDEDVEE